MSQIVTAGPDTGPWPSATRLSTGLVVIGVAVLLVSLVNNAMERQLFYPLLPEISADHGFSLAQGGLLATGFTLGIAVAGIPTGYLVDRLSRKGILMVSIAIYSAGTIATPLAAGFGDMMVYRLISGFGIA